MVMDEDGIQTREALELSDYLRVIRERFWIIPAAVIVVLVVTLVVSLTSTPQYRASARLLYQKNNLEQALFGSQVFTNTNQDREVQTGAALVKLEPVAQAVKEELSSSRSTSSLLDMVSTKSQTTSNVVDVIATGPDAAEAAAVANSFAGQFILFRQNADRATVAAARDLVDNEIRSLSRADQATEYGLTLKEKYARLRIIEAMQNGGFTVVQQASVPTGPFSPNPVRDSMIAIVLGLIGGVGLAFLLDYLDKAVKDDKALEKLLGAPVLTKVPLIEPHGRGGKEDLRLEVVGFSKRPVLLEAFRTLRSNLEFFAVEKRNSTWLVTSCEPQEGKSTTAVNLALSMAISGKRVVVIDADLRKPTVHEYVGVAQSPGLSNLLAGSKRLEESLKLVKADEFMPPSSRRRPGETKSSLLHRNIYVLASGPIPPNPAELLASAHMADLIRVLGDMCDCVIIDTPPVLAVSDAVTLSRYADGVVVVARLGSTSRDQIYEVREVFERSNARVVGAVAFEAKKSALYGRKRGHGYGYGYEYEQHGETENDTDLTVSPPRLPAG